MLKLLIRKFFAIFGLQVSRLPSDSPFKAKSSFLQFGPYRIATDNPGLVRAYRDYPETNAAIGRVVSLLARQGPLAMIDVGANCGDTLALAKQASPESQVLCIEGDKYLFSQLEANAIQFSGVTLKNEYLGEEKAQITASVAMRGENNTLIHAASGAGETEVISIQTLDELVASWPGLAQLRFIKCDTEGYDVRVLCGGQVTLRRAQPVLFFEYNRHAMQSSGETGLRIFSLLAEVGYHHAGLYDECGRFILKLDLTNRDLIQDLHDYADGKHGKIYYYDVMAFGRRDDDLAREFFREERRHRVEALLDA